MITFIGGVITATWKLRGFADRLTRVEEFQKQCAGNTLEKIDEKLDWIIMEGLREVHTRIDSIKDGK